MVMIHDIKNTGNEVISRDYLLTNRKQLIKLKERSVIGCFYSKRQVVPQLKLKKLIVEYVIRENILYMN